MLGFLNPKIVITPSFWMVVGIVVTSSGVVGGIILKVITMGFISREKAFKEFQSKEMCKEKSGNLEKQLKGLKDYMCGRFDTIDIDIKSLLSKK